MKKFTLTVFFSMIIVVFIGFNYLLWEREGKDKDIKSLEDINASNSIAINALNRQLENIENALRVKSDNLDRAVEENDSLKEELQILQSEIEAVNELVNDKWEIVKVLYKNNQPEDIVRPIVEWVEYINLGNYEEAYSRWYRDPEDEEENGLAEFTSCYQDVVKNIQISSIDAYSGDISQLREEALFFQGDMFLLLKLEVELKEEFEETIGILKGGENSLILLLKYDYEEDRWYLSDLKEDDIEPDQVMYEDEREE